MEMEYWWERNKGLIDVDIVRGGYTTDEIEDFTGCIPLLLESCVVGGKIDLHAEAITSVWKQVAMFISKVKENAIGESWERYATLLEFKTLLTSIDIVRTLTLVLDTKKCLST